MNQYFIEKDTTEKKMFFYVVTLSRLNNLKTSK